MDARLTVRSDQPGATIDRNLHGQFAEHLGRGIYDGIWVGTDSPIPNTRGIRTDVVAALRVLDVPVVRWPGGCFADEYHWRDGIGPRDARPRRINRSWGGVVETNAFGTHEFMDFAELIGAAAYVNGNVGTGSPQELLDWHEYLTADPGSELADLRAGNGRERPWVVPYLGFGNEAWGCGGHMTAAEYAAEYRRFASFIRPPNDRPVFRIAAGGDGQDLDWIEVLMASASASFDGLSTHYYTLPTGDWERHGPATGFDEAGWISTLWRALRVEDVLRAHEGVMDRHDPASRVALVLDEWGTWYDPDPGTEPSSLRQQSSLRDALVAAITLNVLHGHAARVRMANVAQLANVLMAMVLTDGACLVLTPTYHAFEMYRPFQDATSIAVDLDAPGYHHGGMAVPSVHASAARDRDGRLWLGLVNLRPADEVTVALTIADGEAHAAAGRVLTGPQIDSVNAFDSPDAVRPRSLEAGAAKASDGPLALRLPARSVAVLEIT